MSTIAEAAPRATVAGPQRPENPLPHIAFLAHHDSNLYVFRRPLMKALAASGWRVTALTPDGEYARRWQNEGVEWVECELSQKSRNPFADVVMMKKLRDTIRALGPDILHTFTAKPNVYGTICGKMAGTPVVVNTITGLGSGFVDREGLDPSRAILTQLYRVSGRLTNAITFQNRDDYEFFEDHGFLRPHVRCEFIPGSGVDLDLYSQNRFSPQVRAETRSALGIPNDAVLVTFVARLIWDKGVREFCEAAERLRAELGPRVVFLSVGDYYEDNPSCVPRDYVEARVAVGDIVCAGWRSDIPELLYASDIVTLPSYLREGIPHALQQACAMGKPIVTTDNPGCREAVQAGVNGFIVPIRNSRMLADALRQLILDAELRSHFGIESRRRAEQEYGIVPNIEKHVRLYTEMLQKHAPYRSAASRRNESRDQETT